MLIDRQDDDLLEVTPGLRDVTQGSDAPIEGPAIFRVGEAFSDAVRTAPGLAASFRRHNPLVSALVREQAPDHVDEDYMAKGGSWEGVKGTKYEAHWDSFVDIHNQQAEDARKRQIDREIEAKQIEDAMPWWQALPGQILAGTLDPTIALPGVVWVKGAKGALSAIRTGVASGAMTGVGVAAQEAVLQATQETRELSESATNIGGSIFLGGLLGAGAAAVVGRGAKFRASRDIERSVQLDANIPGVTVHGDLLTPEGVEAQVLADHFSGFEAWHGSAHAVERFDISKVGTGQGAQSYGHGLYFAQNKAVAENYKFEGGDAKVNGRLYNPNDPLHRAVAMVDESSGSREAALVEARKMQQSDIGDYWNDVVGHLSSDRPLPKLEGSQNIYRVQINADQSKFLDWDKTVGEQPEIVQNKFKELYSLRFPSKDALELNAGEAYRRLEGFTTPKSVAQEFAEAGIPGIRYLDQGSRGKDTSLVEKVEKTLRDTEETLKTYPDNAELQARREDLKAELERFKPTRNFVVFDDKLVEIVDRNGVPVASAMAPSGGAPASLGAAATPTANVEIAGRAASALAKGTRQLNPLLRALQSESKIWREVATNLMENPLYLKGNFDGVRSQTAVETLMQEWNGGLVKALQSQHEAYKEYRKSHGRFTKGEFLEEVGKAMRRGDQHADPAVTRAAQAWRENVFEPMKLKAIELKMLPEDVSVETAQSYFSRMYNRNKIIAQENTFKEIVARWVHSESPKWATKFDEETAAAAGKLEGDKKAEYLIERRIERSAQFDDLNEKAREIAEEVFNKITGKLDDRSVRPEFLTIKTRGPLKERTFNIPDALIEDFLEHNVERVGRRYTRIMGSDIELTNKFGSVDMAEQIQKIRDDYAKLRAGAETEKERMRLDKAETNDIDDLKSVRNLIRGLAIEGQFEGHNYARLARSFNHFNYLRSMGQVVLSSLTDAFRPAMVHGLGQYMQTMGHLTTNLQAFKMSVAEAQLAGNVAERWLGTRLGTMSDLFDPYASRGAVESALEKMTDVASTWNGIRIWTDAMKSIASVATQNRILKNVEKFTTLNKRESAYMNMLGIDESMAGRIAKQMKKHGRDMDGVRVANTEDWDDRVAVRTYRAAINKDVDSIIVERSVGDAPLLANTATGKLLLQFKGFMLASHQRVLLRGMQEDQARFVSGMVALTGIGMLQAYARSWTDNRPEERTKMANNPGWWIGEGLDRSGIFSIPFELANTFEKATGGNPLKGPLKAFDSGSGMSQKLQNRNELGQLLGPTAGLIGDAMTAAKIPGRMIQGEEITRGQGNALTRLFPYNSYLGIRQMFQYVINPPPGN